MYVSESNQVIGRPQLDTEIQSHRFWDSSNIILDLKTTYFWDLNQLILTLKLHNYETQTMPNGFLRMKPGN